jgi:hypothetical protein
LIGISLAIIAWLTFQAGILAVGSTASVPAASTVASQVTAPTNYLFYLIAFVVGYREQVFRQLIKRVADVILAPGDNQPPVGAALPLISALNPTNGRAREAQPGVPSLPVLRLKRGFTGRHSVWSVSR